MEGRFHSLTSSLRNRLKQRCRDHFQRTRDGDNTASKQSQDWLYLALQKGGGTRCTYLSSTSLEPHPLRQIQVGNPDTCLRFWGRRRTQRQGDGDATQGPRAVAGVGAALLLKCTRSCTSGAATKEAAPAAPRAQTLPSAFEPSQPTCPARNIARGASPAPATERSQLSPPPSTRPARFL